MCVCGGGESVPWGDILSTLGRNLEYCEEYLAQLEGYLENHGDILSIPGVILSTLGES